MIRAGSDQSKDEEVARSRLHRVVEAFSKVADPYDESLDPLMLAERLVDHSVRLTAAGTAGLMLLSAREQLRAVAGYDDRAEKLQGLQAQTGQGPSLDSWRSGESVRAPRLEDHAERWPRFAALAADLGVRGIYSVPVRVGAVSVGTLSLLVTEAGELPEDDLTLVSSLAHVAAAAMLRWRAEPPRPSDILTRVQSVISAKASLETALGMIAAVAGSDIPAANRALEAYSRRSGLRAGVVAQRLLRRELSPGDVLAAEAAPAPGSTAG
jgi:hypothetical protein